MGYGPLNVEDIQLTSSILIYLFRKFLHFINSSI